MKKTIQSFLFSTVVAGALLTSCDTKEKNVEEAKENVQESKAELKQAKVDEAYPAFKKNAEELIESNEKHIDDLQAKLDKPGKSVMDDARRQKIENLKKQNADLRAELYGYEKEPSDWDKFKVAFNHDADNLRDAFKDFGNDLKKKN